MNVLWESGKLKDRVLLVGDDLFVTQQQYLKRGIDLGAANSILLKFNQAGTLTETLDTMEMAAGAGYAQVMSHRSGETDDTTIANLAYPTHVIGLKTGAPRQKGPDSNQPPESDVRRAQYLGMGW